ncbi:membrane protein [Nitrospira sp.]|nr:membrane protein [Nitrospira sp.]
MTSYDGTSFWIPVTLWVLLLASAAWSLSHLSVTTDMTALLPESADPVQQVLVTQLREGVAARLILIGLEGAPSEQLAAHSHRMADRLRAGGHFSLVANGDSREIAAAGRTLFQRRYVLSPSTTRERFSPEGLRSALEDRLRQLQGSANPLTKRVAASDPTGAFDDLLARLDHADSPNHRHGVWFSPDGTRAYLIAETRAPGSELDRQAEALRMIRSAAQLPDDSPAVRLRVTGPGVFAVESRQTIEHDSWRLSLIAGLLVTVLLVTTYRSPTPVWLSAVPVLTGLAVGMAGVQQLFGYVHGITLGFGATLIGEAVDYPAYAQLHARQGEPLRQTVPRIWPTLRLAILTTMFGALSLLLSSFTGLSQLGVLTVLGVGTAGCVTRWVLPALSIRPAPAERGLPWAGRPLFLRGPGAAVRITVWLACAVALATIIWRADRMWDDDLAHLSPIAESAKRLDEEMRRDIGAPDVRYLLVIRGATQEDVLRRSESAVPLLESLVDHRIIDGFDLPSRYLPSRVTQERRLKALPDPGTLDATLATALKGLPFRTRAFDPFRHAIEEARREGPIDASALEGTPWGLKLQALLFPQGLGWVGLAPLRGINSIEAVREHLTNAELPGTTWFDLKTEAERLVSGYRRESLSYMGIGIAAIAGILLWGLRSPLLAARVLGPPLMAAVWVVAVLLTTGTRLSLFHLVALLLVIGIGLNYALFVDQYRRRSLTDEDRGRTALSLTVCILATLAAFGTLSTSQTPVLHAIGSTVALGALLSLVLALLLGPERETPR